MQTSTPSSPRRWFRPTARERRWLLALAALALAAFFGWKPLRHDLAMFLVLRCDGPSESVLLELVTERADQAKTLERMWRSPNLTARAFVMNYLSLRLHTDPLLLSRLKAIVQEAACDPDLEARAPALAILAEQNDPESLLLLRQQLRDADPAVRVLALQQLQHRANSNDVSSAVGLLDDPDPRVVVQAASLLRRVTGLDFGIRVNQALPRFTVSDDAPPSLERNLELIEHGVARWREWWTQHRREFPEPLQLPPATAPALPVKAFALADSNGRTFHLSDFPDRAVLLCFWKTGSTNFADLPALKQLQEEESQRLAVLGMAFDAGVGPQDCCAEHETLQPGHEHHHDHANMPQTPSAVPITAVVRNLVAQNQIPFPVLQDQQGTAAFRFNVQEIPTYILIDGKAKLRRRFTGSRNLPVFKALVHEAARPLVLSRSAR